MKAAVLGPTSSRGRLDSERLRALLLVRVAAAEGASRTEITGELTPLLTHRLSGVQARAAIERELDALVSAELVASVGGRMAGTSAGRSQAGVFLGLKGEPPAAWREAGARLIAKALGLEREPAKRLATLATAEGLNSAVVQHAYGLKIKGLVTPARLRAALAALALERAFGHQLNADRAGGLGLSAKAGRLLAGQLAKKPRDFGTDARLIAALAADYAGRPRADPATLRTHVLRRYLEGGVPPPGGRARTPARTSERQAVALPPPPATRPDLAGFASEVRGHALGSARGWAGDRKAYISHVWQRLRALRPEWGLSEIEFKCMLAEAHRTGKLVLANADLKEDSNLRDVQDSALVYKNSVFHFVRVDV